MLTSALEGDDLSAARVPALRLENVLKVSPMFRESLRELKTGIQGIPVARFLDEPEASDFGPPGDVRFVGRRLAESSGAGRGLAVGDFSGPTGEDVEVDRRAGIARLRADGWLEIFGIEAPAKGWQVSQELETTSADGTPAQALLAVDVDNDGGLDLVACGPEHCVAYRGTSDGFVPAPDDFGLTSAGAAALETVDFDIEGDLDLVTAGAASGPAVDLWRNSLSGPLDSVGQRALPDAATKLSKVRAVFASDLDRDGDLDLAVAHGSGTSFFANLRQGQFEDRTEASGLGEAHATADVVSADLDGDGRPELVTALLGLRVWRNLGASPDETRFERTSPDGLPATGVFHRVVAFDADNDGRLDLAAAGPGGLGVWQQQADGSFEALVVEDGPARSDLSADLAASSGLEAADLDCDGDLDLVARAAGPPLAGEPRRQRRTAGCVRLRGLDKGNSKNNLFGVGSLVEVRTGSAYQFREAAATSSTSASARRERRRAAGGVDQRRAPEPPRRRADQRLVEEQLLKGSCPFLYAWDGEGFRFVTDLLWGAPLGLPAAPGAWVPADPSELVRVDGSWLTTASTACASPRSCGRRPSSTTTGCGWSTTRRREVASALDLPGAAGRGERHDRRGARARGLRAVARPRTAADATSRPASPPATSLRRRLPRESLPGRGAGLDVHLRPRRGARTAGAPALDGWIFPADASLNLAVSQRGDYPYLPPRLEVETADGWRDARFGPTHGPPGRQDQDHGGRHAALARRRPALRIVSSLWLHWDRIGWMPLDERAADRRARRRGASRPSRADLHYRGFSALVRQAPNAPHAFDYARVRLDSPWLAFPGGYTRYGDVRALLEELDDFSVVLAPGDEMALDFDASAPAAARRRHDAHSVPREPRLGQGRRPQHLAGAPGGSAALPRHGLVSVSGWSHVPRHTGASAVCRGVADAVAGWM